MVPRLGRRTHLRGIAIMPHQLKSGVGSCHVVVVVGVWLAVGMLQPSRVNKLPC